VLPERQEVCESELAGSIDLGRDRLVDRRRRQLIQPQPDAAHTGLFHDGSRPVSQLADGQGRTLHPLHDKIEDERQATLLHNGDESGHREANWRSKNLLADLHALQAHTAANDICSNMPVLQRNISAERVSAFRSSKVSRTCVLLPGKGLSESAWARGTSTIHQSARQERATQCSWQGTLLPELGGFKNPTPEAPSQLHGKSSRGIQQTQTDGQSRSQSSQAESATYLRDMPRPIREDEQGRVAEVLPYLQTTGDTSEQSEVRLEEVSIESIKYAGYRHVYDIETALNHTFIANNIAISNCQDMDPNLIPIIKETMSASKWRLSMYTGTPKTLDNTIEGLWQSSSQAEWCIPCMNCKKLNVPHMGMDLEKMIGPNRDDICDDNPAVICAKCRLPINPRKGRWMHKFKERRFEFPGYHIPQIVMPIHYSSHKRWGELLAKQQGYGNYTIPQFYNEVLGESYDVGAKLLTKTDLENASVLPWANEPLHGAEAVRRKEDYVIRVLGVDWGGGGELRRGADKKKTENITMSFTCAAVVGLRGDGRLDVIYGRRLLTPHDHMEEAKQLMRIYQMFDCQLMAHDYNGAGALRETIVVQSGVPLNRVVPIVYTRSAWQNIMNFHRSEDKHSRNFWLVDKARSLQLLCQCIKMVQIRLFKHDYVSEENRGLQHDFLSLMENKVETARGPDIYTIQRNPHFPDDFAHAVNFAACALWNETKSWPNVAELAHLKMTVQQMNQINPVRPWLEGGYLGQP